MGPAKGGGGKTTTVLTTSPAPVGILLCEDDSALNEAKRQKAPFVGMRFTAGASAWNSAISMLSEVRAAVKANQIKTLVIDPFTDLAFALEQELLTATNNDGRRTYPVYKQRLIHILDNLFQLPIHIIAVCHFLQSESDKENDKGKKHGGNGRMPMLPGSAAEKIAAKFHDVVWTEVRNDAKEGKLGLDGMRRVFVTGPEGIWTTGGARSLQGTHVLPADVTAFIKTIKDEAKRPPALSVAKPNGAVAAGAKTTAPPTQVRR
jgi:hypothetical protein